MSVETTVGEADNNRNLSRTHNYSGKKDQYERSNPQKRKSRNFCYSRSIEEILQTEYFGTPSVDFFHGPIDD